MFKLPSIENETELVRNMLTDDREGPDIAEDYGIGTKLLNERMRHQRKFYLDLDSMSNEDVVSAITQIGGSIHKQARWFKLSPNMFRNKVFNKLMTDAEFKRLYQEEDFIQDEYSEAIGLPGFILRETMKRRANSLKVRRLPGYEARILKKVYYDNEDVKNRAKVRREQTMLDRYGVPYPLKNKSILDKLYTTNIKRYGDKIVLKSPVYIDSHNNGENIPSGRSMIEISAMSDMLAGYSGDILYNYRPDFLGGKEIDLVIFNEETKQNIGIEFNGLYWHSTNSGMPKEETYHIDKVKKLHKENYNSLLIWENDWRHRKYPYIKTVQKMFGDNSINKVNISSLYVKESTYTDFMTHSSINSIEKYLDTSDKENSEFIELKESGTNFTVAMFEITRDNYLRNPSVDNNIVLYGSYKELIKLTTTKGIILDNDYSNYLMLKGYTDKESADVSNIFKNYKGSNYDIASSGFSKINY